MAASPGSTRPAGLTRFACQDLYLFGKSKKANPYPAFRHRQRPIRGAPLRDPSPGELQFNARPNTYLSHARKQIAASNPAAARHELDEAAQWLRTAADCGSIKLLRGLIDERSEQGNALLREGLA
jgi:hypothetical protein